MTPDTTITDEVTPADRALGRAVTAQILDAADRIAAGHKILAALSPQASTAGDDGLRRALESIATANDLWGTNGCMELRKIARAALSASNKGSAHD